MITKEYLLQEYYKNKRSLAQIGQDVGLSPGTVAYWVQELITSFEEGYA